MKLDMVNMDVESTSISRFIRKRIMPESIASHYIAGNWIADAPNGFDESINPANGQSLGRFPLGSDQLASAAVLAARQAFEQTAWACDPNLRSRVLFEFADRMEANKERLARLLSSENGKLLVQATHEISAAVSEARYYGGVARNIFGRVRETGPGNMSILAREPAGVVSVIVPWNAPATLLVRSAAPALAAGCCLVIKPAPQTPLTNARVISLFDGIECLPKGVVNSVNECGIEVGSTLSTHPDIDVISFTGSSETGKKIMANAAASVKRVSLELGGKAPAIVFGEADLEKATREIVRASLTLNGQMCTSISRVLAQDEIALALEDRLNEAFKRVVLGDPLDPGVQLGPLIDRANQERVLGIINRARHESELILEGSAPGGRLSGGCYVSPTLFRIDDTDHWLVQGELFGPIVSLESFEDENEAVAKANATRFGLAASVYTPHINRAMGVARRLKFGTVWLNSHNRLFAEAETGGYRESGIGRLHGLEAMHDFLETKHIYLEADG